jgi:hypothetical protein
LKRIFHFANFRQGYNLLSDVMIASTAYLNFPLHNAAPFHTYTITTNLMCSMSVHYIVQKKLNTNKCTKRFFVNYNTLLHVSTLLGHLLGETFRCRYTRLHYTVKRECAVDCALRRFWTAKSSRLQVEERYFCLLQNVQTCSGAHPASYSVGTGVL